MHEHSHDHDHSHEHPHGHDRGLRPVSDAPSGDAALERLEESLEQAWRRRLDADRDITAALEALIATRVAQAMPDASAVLFYEDRSHDAPHGHIRAVCAEDGTVLLAGTGDEWHDLAWTHEIDELVFDLFTVDRARFSPRGGADGVILLAAHVPGLGAGD